MQAIESALPIAVGGSAVRRWPRHGSREFVRGGSFLVPDDTAAVFGAGGQAADGLGSGEHTLSRKTVPRLFATAGSSSDGGRAIDACVYFFPTDWRECRWGTRYPVAFRDNMFGVLRLRAFGTYRVRVVNPPLFVNSVIIPGEAHGIFESDALVRDLISSRLADFLSERVDTVMDLTRYIEIAPDEIGRRLAGDFRCRGLELDAFSIQNVTVPDDVMLTLEARSGIGAVKGVVQFLRGQIADAVRDGTDAVAVTGVAPFGGDATDVEPSRVTPVAWGARPVDLPETDTCPCCENTVPGGSHACSYCAHTFYVRHRCPSCTAENPSGWQYCIECGSQNEPVWSCPSCATEIPVGSRFCMACGNGAASE